MRNKEILPTGHNFNGVMSSEEFRIRKAAYDKDFARLNNGARPGLSSLLYPTLTAETQLSKPLSPKPAGINESALVAEGIIRVKKGEPLFPPKPEKK